MRNLFSLLNFPARRRLEAMRPRLYRLAYAWCHDHALADDLTQEALHKALDRGDQLREDAAMEGWLFAILNNCWRDHLRRRRDFADVSEIDEIVFAHDDTPERLYSGRQAILRVRQAIAGLPVGQRQVVTLVDIEECSYADVARILDVPVGTVMSRLARARQALREKLMAAEAAAARPALRRVK